MVMNLKIVGFVVLASFGSFLLATYVEAAKVTDFIQHKREAIEDDSERLILATAIANRNDGSDAFILKQPFLDRLVESPSLQARIRIYALSLFTQNESTDVLALFIDDLVINDNEALLDNDGFHIVNVTLGFNQAIKLNSNTPDNSFETFVTLYTNEQKLILIELDELLNKYPTLKITSMMFSYTLQNQQQSTFESIDEEGLVNLDQFQLFQPYGSSYLISQEILYDPTLLSSLEGLNHYYISHFSVYIAIVSILTYALFFQKKKIKSS
jgi:hypothetical protein